MSRSSVFLFLAVMAFALIATFAGCTPHKAYRVPESIINTNILDLKADPLAQQEVARHCVESHDNFSLAFVEFDDQGDFWDRNQLDALHESLDIESNRTDTDGLIIVVFVHGWKHNAQVCDENVSCFREVLTGIANAEQLRTTREFEEGGAGLPRRVIGVYVGWRGLSITAPILKELSFYARKSAAHRVGSGEVIELLTILESKRNNLNRRSVSSNTTRLITVGHSFGSAVTFSAISKILHRRLANGTLGTAVGSPIQSFGDLVVLVNPAFEAALYSGIHNIASSQDSFVEDQKPTLAVLSSETDSATGFFFPIGRFFSTMFDKTSSTEQKKALKTTLGNYERYRTHEAMVAPVGTRGSLLPDIVESSEDVSRGKLDCSCSYIEVTPTDQIDFEMHAAKAREEYIEITPEKARYGKVQLDYTGNGGSATNPFYVIRTSDEIITEHNGIYNQIFLDFLRVFILDNDATELR